MTDSSEALRSTIEMTEPRDEIFRQVRSPHSGDIRTKVASTLLTRIRLVRIAS
jgi:hypothetical protein